MSLDLDSQPMPTKWTTRWGRMVARKPSRPGIYKMRGGGYLVRGRITDPQTGTRSTIIRALHDATLTSARVLLQRLKEDARTAIRRAAEKRGVEDGPHEDMQATLQKIRAVAQTPSIPWPESSGVYFARMPGTDVIKIGVAKNVAKRLRSFMCSMPRPLALLCVIPGGRSIEGAMHQRFRKLREAGGAGSEWFRLGPELLEFVRSARTETP